MKASDVDQKQPEKERKDGWNGEQQPQRHGNARLNYRFRHPVCLSHSSYRRSTRYVDPAVTSPLGAGSEFGCKLINSANRPTKIAVPQAASMNARLTSRRSIIDVPIGQPDIALRGHGIGFCQIVFPR